MIIFGDCNSSNVHIWAMFFLRHLANMSCMVPFWASNDSGFVPIWGPRPKPRRPERLFIVLMTAAHISPNIFSLRNFLSNIHRLFLRVHASSFIHLYAHLHLLFTCLIHTFTSSDLHGGRLPSVPCVWYKHSLANTMLSAIYIMQHSIRSNNRSV